jgi:hypothetical protein
VDYNPVLSQVLDALAIYHGIRVFEPHPDFLDPCQYDALRAAELGMPARSRSAGLECGEEFGAVESAASVLTLQKCVLGVVAVP